MRKSIGWTFGQEVDFRLTLANGGCLPVREFDKYYEAHIDLVDPVLEPVEHLRRDLPDGWVVGFACIGAAVGILLARQNKKQGVLIGILTGAAIGMITVE